MYNNLTITKDSKKMDEFKEKIGIDSVDNCEVLFINKEYHNGDSHILFKNHFQEFLNEKNSSLNIMECKMNIDTVKLPNTQLWQIGEFIVREIVLPLAVTYLYDFIKSKMETDDNICLKIDIERKNDENISIQYNGSVNNLKTIIHETNNFKDLIDNDK